ncbi:MAG: alpha/beta hydrolase [Bacteroidia bacterium]|nr:alpha/beta hydrolase [Bacteroidia bacterium]
MELYYQEFGIENEKSILFIHGAGMPGWFWEKQVTFFSKEYHCIVVDLPDHGKSASTPFTTIEAVAGQLLALIKKAGHNERAIVVGHSLGAKIAACMVSMNTGKIDKAVFASALFHKSLLTDWMTSKTIIRWSVFLIQTFPVLLKWQAKLFHFEEEEMEKAYISESLSMNTEAMMRYMTAFNSMTSVPDSLSPVPVLILTGSKEPPSMKKSAMSLLGTFRNAIYLNLKNCNHVYPVNDVGLFNSVLSQWFKNTRVQTDERLTVVSLNKNGKV